MGEVLERVYESRDSDDEDGRGLEYACFQSSMQSDDEQPWAQEGDWKQTNSVAPTGMTLYDQPLFVV